MSGPRRKLQPIPPDTAQGVIGYPSPVPPPSPAPPIRHRWETALLLIVLATLALALVARVLPVLGARLTVATRAAQWIWESRDRRDVSPAAFYAVRDFDLTTVPGRARVLVMADEEYILSLNGRRIGAGSWERGAPLDVYEVGPLLQPGPNRLLAELRSGRGEGGFLLSLEDGDGRQLLGTDKRWRIFHQHHPGLIRGWLPLARKPDDPPQIPESEPAFCWGVPPTGAWGRPVPGEPRSLLFEVTSGAPVPAATVAPAGGQDSPAEHLFDWGRNVAGYLTIELPPAPDLRVGLLFTGDAPPDPHRDRPAASVLALPRQRVWRAARPDRFRYALVVGIASPQGAAVQPVDAAVLPRLLPKPHTLKGVFGITPPPLRTPVENEVWSELERVPGVAGRKKR